jgi:hypothetical protein
VNKMINEIYRICIFNEFDTRRGYTPKYLSDIAATQENHDISTKYGQDYAPKLSDKLLLASWFKRMSFSIKKDKHVFAIYVNSHEIVPISK